MGRLLRCVDVFGVMVVLWDDVSVVYWFGLVLWNMLGCDETVYLVIVG